MAFLPKESIINIFLRIAETHTIYYTNISILKTFTNGWLNTNFIVTTLTCILKSDMSIVGSRPSYFAI